MSKGRTFEPLLAVLKPVARKYITRENINSVYDAVTGDVELEEGEKAMVILSRNRMGDVVAGVYAVDGEHRVRRQYKMMTVEELVVSILEG